MPVHVDLAPLNRFAASVETAMRGPSGSPMRRAVKQWAVIYRAWAKERFSRLSRGGGGWAPLKPATIEARRKGKERTIKSWRHRGKRGKKKRWRSTTKTVAKGTVAILIDTETLIGGLDPSFNPAKGALQKDIPFGVTVGYGGRAKHEESKGTIALIAHAHQTGNKARNLPARPIIVEPPKRVVEQMAEVAEKALAAEWRQATA